MLSEYRFSLNVILFSENRYSSRVTKDLVRKKYSMESLWRYSNKLKTRGRNLEFKGCCSSRMFSLKIVKYHIKNWKSQSRYIMIIQFCSKPKNPTWKRKTWLLSVENKDIKELFHKIKLSGPWKSWERSFQELLFPNYPRTWLREWLTIIFQTTWMSC